MIMKTTMISKNNNDNENNNDNDYDSENNNDEKDKSIDDFIINFYTNKKFTNLLISLCRILKLIQMLFHFVLLLFRCIVALLSKLSRFTLWMIKKAKK